MEQKRRAPLSCDSCRSRKVRCIRLSDGACQSCAKYSRECTTSKAKTARPQYQTSKEQYHLMTKALRHFIPDISLEKDQLREVVARLNTESHTRSAKSPDSEVSTRTYPNHGSSFPDQARKDSEAEQPNFGSGEMFRSVENHQPDESHLDATPVGRLESLHDDISTRALSQVHEEHSTRGSPRNVETSKEHVSGSEQAAQSPLDTSDSSRSIIRDGIMLDDVMHTPRLHNGISFTAFYHKISTNLAPKHDHLFRKLRQFHNHLWSDGYRTQVVRPQSLPPQATVLDYARKFFSEINCVIYILSQDYFQRLLESIYVHRRPSNNASLALIYLLLSLWPLDSQYFADGTNFCTASIEESSIESVQALMLMALCRLNRNQRHLAWIASGTALRIAQTLGLHMDQPCEDNDVGKKRLWWSLYEMDMSLNCTAGTPFGLDENQCHRSVDCEMAFNLDPHNPPGYATASARLGKLFVQTLRNLPFCKPQQLEAKVALKELLTPLQQWWDSLPAHLRAGNETMASSSRAVSFLSLRYYYIIILISRTYLLDSVMHPDLLDQYQSACVKHCERANTESLRVIRELARVNMICKWSYFDFHFVLANGMILFLRCLKNPCREFAAEVKELLPVMKEADHLHFARFGLLSYQILLEDLGKSYKDIGSDNDSVFNPVEIPKSSLGADEVIQAYWASTDFAWFEEPVNFNFEHP